MLADRRLAGLLLPIVLLAGCGSSSKPLTPAQVRAAFAAEGIQLQQGRRAGETDLASRDGKVEVQVWDTVSAAKTNALGSSRVRNVVVDLGGQQDRVEASLDVLRHLK